MSKKQESLRVELQKVLSRGGRTVINKASDGKTVPVPEEAEVFEFDFTKEGETYGKVFVSIDGLRQLIVYFDDSVSTSPKNGSTDSESWEQLIKTLKRFAMMKQLSFKLDNIDNLENDMAKREHTKRQEKMYEGYHAQGKKASYSDNVPTTKIIIKHKREMQEGEQRFRQIDKIFIENTIGERMLAPTDRPGLARVFARHIAEGGKANDDRWNHISSLCEEYQQMAGFVRATRNGQFNESAQKLVTEGINHYQKLRECLSKMSGQRGYNAYFESYTPALMEDEEQVDLSEMFMSSSLDPRIESVMPILSKLSRNITETSDMAETIALEEWASEIIGEAPEPTKTKPSRQDVAKKMHGILSKSVNKSNMARVKTQQAVGSRVADIGAGGKEYNVKTDAAWDAKEKDLSEDSFDSPVASAITRRILMQRADLLSKYGPEKVTAAIDDVADFVGDTEEIGSSDVSGWVKQVEQSLGGNELEEALDPEKKQRLDDLISRYEDATDPEDMGDERHEDIIAQIRTEFGDKTADSVANGPSMHFPRPGHSMGHDDLEFKQIRKTLSPNRITKVGKLHKQDNDAMKLDIKDKLGVRWKKEGPKGIKVDEDSEFAGDYATGEAGQWRNKGPKANKPATIGDLVGESIAEGQEDLDAIKRLLGK